MASTRVLYARRILTPRFDYILLHDTAGIYRRFSRRSKLPSDDFSPTTNRQSIKK
jgi:hypothetical protein